MEFSLKKEKVIILENLCSDLYLNYEWKWTEVSEFLHRIKYFHFFF